MKRPTPKRHRFVWGLFLTIIILSGAASAAAQGFSVVDMADRTVTFPAVPQRILLVESRDIHEISAILGDDFPKMIVGWGPDLKAWDRDTYDHYLDKFPKVASIPEVGFMEEGTFDVEKAIALKPDVVILALWMYQWLDQAKTAMAALDRAGIPVLVVDYGLDPVAHPPQSILLTGRVLGREDRARAMADYYQRQVDDVLTRVKGVKAPPPLVYVECGFKGPKEFGNTYLGHSWDLIVKAVGGRSAAKGLPKATAPIDPEHLLNVNPDVIVITGSYWAATPGAMRLGYQTEAAQARALLGAFVERPGWSALKAVQDHRVHSIYHGFSFRVFNFAAVQAFAEWLYPRDLTDLNPVGSLKTFSERFEPVKYGGTWMIDLYE